MRKRGNHPMYFCYCITNLVSGRRYVGITYDVKMRWKQHVKGAAEGHASALSHAIRAHGPESFSMDVLHSGNDWQEMQHVERYFIVELGSRAPNGYNLTDGGDNTMSNDPDVIRRRTETQRANLLDPNWKAAYTAKLIDARARLMADPKRSAERYRKWAEKCLAPERLEATIEKRRRTLAATFSDPERKKATVAQRTASVRATMDADPERKERVRQKRTEVAKARVWTPEMRKALGAAVSAGHQRRISEGRKAKRLPLSPEQRQARGDAVRAAMAREKAAGLPHRRIRGKGAASARSRPAQKEDVS